MTEVKGLTRCGASDTGLGEFRLPIFLGPLLVLDMDFGLWHLLDVSSDGSRGRARGIALGSTA